MNNPIIIKARDDFRKLIMSEITKQLLNQANHGLQFNDNPVKLDKTGETIVSLRYDRGRILVGLDTDMEVEEEDFELYSIDEMLAMAEKVF